MKKIFTILFVVLFSFCKAQHGFIIKDSASTIFVSGSHLDVGQMLIVVQSLTEASDSSTVTANLFFYSDTINYKARVTTNPNFYTLPFNSNQFTVVLTSKIWVTVPQALAYLKNWWNQQGYSIGANIN